MLSYFWNGPPIAGLSFRLACHHVFHVHIIVDRAHTAFLISTHLMQKETPSAADHSVLSPWRQIVFPVARWAVMHCVSAHLPLISNGPRAVSMWVRSWGRDVAGAPRGPDGTQCRRPEPEGMMWLLPTSSPKEHRDRDIPWIQCQEEEAAVSQHPWAVSPLNFISMHVKCQ